MRKTALLVRGTGFPDEFKGAPDVGFSGVNVPDRDAKGITATDAGGDWGSDSRKSPGRTLGNTGHWSGFSR